MYLLLLYVNYINEVIVKLMCSKAKGVKMSSHISKAIELRDPKRKRVGPHIKPQQPFPIIIESESGIPAENELWPLYIGNFTGDEVVVSNPDEMKTLYTMGFFGKGSFSRGYPSFGLYKKGMPPIIKERQWKRRKCWMESMKKSSVSHLSAQELDKSENCISETEQTNVPSDKDVTVMDIDKSSLDISESTDVNLRIAPGLGNGDEEEIPNSNTDDQVLVLADSDDEDIEKLMRDPQPHLENESVKTAVETLILTIEEAFFLSYALGCLQVTDMTGQPMKLNQLWQMFCEAKPDFIEMYVGYHYFRAKGWVVKTGYKFGGDFLLYKQGPPFYHASYVVIVEKVNLKLQRQNRSLTWTKLHGLNRLAEGSGKDIIICQVAFPDNVAAEELKTPKYLSRLQVNELLTTRWISSQEREEKEVIQE